MHLVPPADPSDGHEERRRAVLQAVSSRFHPDVAPVGVGAWAIVERHPDDAYWLDLGDDVEAELEDLRTSDTNGYEPFLAVELDTGRAYKVRDFSLGAEIEDQIASELRAVALAARPLELQGLSPLGPRARLSALSERLHA